MTRVSIITPTYNLLQNNRKNYFVQMFNSIQEQTYVNLEHIIIDGASTDGTLEFIESLLADTHNVKVISEADTGIYNAFNKGIHHSCGEYIAFMNSDDYYEKNTAISTLVSAIENNNAEFSYSNISFDRAGTVLKADQLRYTYTIPFIHQTMLCKKALLLKYGCFNEAYKIAADHFFFIQILKAEEPGSYVDAELVLFRSGGASNNSELAANEGTAILKELIYTSKHYSFAMIKQFYQKRIVSMRFIITLLLQPIDAPENVNADLKKTALKLFYQQRIRYYVRFRFILKPLEELIKKIRGKS